MRAALALTATSVFACASQPPLVTASAPELCISRGSDRVRRVVLHGDRVGICFAADSPIAAEDCLVIDRIRGQVIRIPWQLPSDGPTDPDLDVTPDPDAVSISQDGADVTLCDRGGCQDLVLPRDAAGRAMSGVSANRTALSGIVREGGATFLETLDLASLKRVGRVPLPNRDTERHFVWTDRIASAVLVRDYTQVSFTYQVLDASLVHPLTGKRIALGDGSAVALDDRLAVVTNLRGAAIIDTETLDVVERLEARGGAGAGVDGAAAVVALADPPMFASIEHGRFARHWRLPVCSD